MFIVRTSEKKKRKKELWKKLISRIDGTVKGKEILKNRKKNKISITQQNK